MEGPGASRFAEWDLELHGHQVVYRAAGSGPAIVLIHGMLNSSRHWEKVALRLAEHHTVVAPDLLGHGETAAPRGDYSLGAHAAGIRDVLAVLGIEHATVVGHSLGGGIAMQFFYQFPQRVDRLVLVSSGGLGHEVSPLLRGAALPGVSGLLGVLAHPRAIRGFDRAGERLRARGSDLGVQLRAVARALDPIGREGARQAFVETLRAVIDVHGQRVSATDRLYLLEDVPTLVVWGERDRTIPVAHGLATHRAIPHSEFATLPAAAHFPHLDDPEGLATVIADFVERTPESPLDDAGWAELLARHTPRRRRTVAA